MGTVGRIQRTNNMKRILIVEDDKEINGLLYKLLEENHYHPQSAFTGMDGMNMLSAEKIIFFKVRKSFVIQTQLLNLSICGIIYSN